jgi:hypothetical protein
MNNDMKKEFIPYELALELKQLGFNKNCIATYDEDRDFKLQDFEQNYDTFPSHIIAAPIYSQAFRWFREKYELGHMINGIGYESFIMNIGGILHIFNGFETYEEAELACLVKLIKIVKEKNE